MLYELKNVQREFKGRLVLDIPQLAIEAGRIYCLIGPNGAGKSTLLNLLAFLDEPSRGEIRFAGERITFAQAQLLAARRRVVLLDQYPILFTGPVWKSVEFGLKVRGVPAGERRKRVKEVLELVGMHHFLDAAAHRLSGGETKRVALARALAVRPEVLLCDEPGANVDKENQEIILAILEKINQTEKTSVIFSTHYLSQGRSLTDRTLMLEYGSLSDMIHENVYRGVVKGRGNGRVQCRVTGGPLLSLPGDLVPPAVENLRLMVDPEAVVLVGEDGGGAGPNVVSGHVFHIDQDRGRVRIGVALGIKLYFFLSMDEYLRKPPVLGGKVTVALPDTSLRCGTNR